VRVRDALGRTREDAVLPDDVLEMLPERCTFAVRGHFPRFALRSSDTLQVTRRDRSLWGAPGESVFQARRRKVCAQGIG
jgi:hypothetical protein